MYLLEMVKLLEAAQMKVLTDFAFEPGDIHSQLSGSETAVVVGFCVEMSYWDMGSTRAILRSLKALATYRS